MNTKLDTALPDSIRVTPQSATTDGIGLRAPGRSIKEKATSASSIAASKGYQVITVSEIVFWAIAALASFAFAIVVITPILVPLLSFGSVFSEGWKEWVEFTKTALKMSLAPALLSATSAAIAMALRKGKAVVANRLAIESEKGAEMRRFEGLIKPSL